MILRLRDDGTVEVFADGLEHQVAAWPARPDPRMTRELAAGRAALAALEPRAPAPAPRVVIAPPRQPTWGGTASPHPLAPPSARPAGPSPAPAPSDDGWGDADPPPDTDPAEPSGEWDSAEPAPSVVAVAAAAGGAPTQRALTPADIARLVARNRRPVPPRVGTQITGGVELGPG